MGEEFLNVIIELKAKKKFMRIKRDFFSEVLINEELDMNIINCSAIKWHT